MGHMMHQQANDSAAVRYLNEALQIFIQQHDLFNEASSRKGLYEALRNSDPALAMEHNDHYLALRDSIFDKNTGELLSKYAAEYGVDELQAENDEMQKTHRRSLIVGVIILVALLIGGVALYQWMRRREQKHTEQLIRKIQELSAALEAGEQVQPDVASSDEEAQEEPEAEPEEETEDHLFLMRVVKAVNDGLPTGRYGVDEIASELNMGTQTFRRRLMKVTGDSPKAFISAIQMERAAKLLTMSPDMPISQVAMRCGYEEATSFTRAFRKAYGVSPSQYKA
jgi:AraC-like DNA-binding protein